MKRSWMSAVVGIVAIAAFASLLINGCSTISVGPDALEATREQQSAQWRDSRFVNPQPMFSDTRGLVSGLFAQTRDQAPTSPVAVFSDGGKTLRLPPVTGLRVTWFGHSSILLEIDGSRILIDPLWSDRASPVSWAGPKRWYPPPIALTDLPPIDAVVISHDHYDHFDRATIVALAKSGARFIVPLGDGAFLRAWGVAAARIVEMDWWQPTQLGAVSIIATPSRHHSGRLSPQSDKRLWCGYAFVGAQHRAWYSGDTGFHDGLADIGKKFGPFDVTLIEAGQYDAAWPDWHLGPEQAVEAHRLVGGRKMIPVHWGLIQLAHHSWTEPVERVLVAARCSGVEVIAPRPGESVEPTTQVALQRWWPRTEWLSASQTPIVATHNGNGSDRYPHGTCTTAGS